MAPLKGITDALFRQVYRHHFTGVDYAIAPFINPHRKTGLSEKLFKDVLPDRNDDLPLVPQLINNDADDFLAASELLFDLGYKEVNWNLGCPVPMVAKKLRGSGLLPYPERIFNILDRVVPRLKPQLSIKMRLGYHEHTEILEILPRLNDYPLSEIIIHPRLGKQLYRGNTFPEHFEICSQLSTHRLTYNGDITDLESFNALSMKFPAISHWMIGRGLIGNPFLPSEIKGTAPAPQLRRNSLRAFHDELYDEMSRHLSGPGHLLGRMKQIWLYLIASFPQGGKTLKKLTKASTTGNYLDAVDKIFAS